VRFDPELIEQALATVPSEFTIHARNPANDVHVGGNHVNFTNAITPPFSNDLDRGRRAGTRRDFEELLKIGQALNALSLFYGYPVEPTDLAPQTRHLDAYRSHIRLTDKVWRGYTLGDDRIKDAIEMARIARGIDAEQLLAEPSFISNVTTNSPLRIDGPMGEGLMIMAEANQPVSITAFTMAGAMAPITLSGAMAQQNAEILAALVLSQLVRPGAPLIYGAFTTNVHMRSGAVAFGNPEFAQATLASGQLARRYAMPYKVAVTTGSKAVDAQAGYETQFTLWAAVAAGGHIVAHAAGFLESGLTTSYEKLIVDAEMLQMFAAMMQPIASDEQSFALQTIAEVGPGGHFFDTPHTLERYETAFYEPLLSDWDNFENWVDGGSLAADRRANGIWKQLLAEYREPELDPAIADELDTYVARRRSEIEAADAA